MQSAPIGIFDSGVGGISVWKAVKKLLPNESIMYFADSKHTPYGNKTQEEIIHLSKQIVDFFIRSEAKLIVLACNTATAAAVDFLRAHYSLPFVGMEPAIKPAALSTQNNKIAVLATSGTFNGRLFNETWEKYASGVEVYNAVGKGFVELVEQGDLDSLKARETVDKVLSPLLEADIDNLVLACTHYPFLRPLMEEMIGERSITIIDPAISVARQVLHLLELNKMLNSSSGKSIKPHYQFYSSSDINVLKKLVAPYLKEEADFFAHYVL